MLQEHDWLLLAFLKWRERRVGDSMHGQDVAILRRHVMRLGRVSVFVYQSNRVEPNILFDVV